MIKKERYLNALFLSFSSCLLSAELLLFSYFLLYLDRNYHVCAYCTEISVVKACHLIVSENKDFTFFQS